MTPETAHSLAAALSASGLYPEADCADAARLLDSPDAHAVETLYARGLLTGYQYKKLRADRPGEIFFGPYLVLDKVGEGGMGKVYRAAQLRADGSGPAGRVAALKIVRQQLVANKTVMARFAREAAAAAALEHPNIVTLFAASDVQGRYYLAMEYVDGLDLARLVREFADRPGGGLPHYQEACEYARQAALGLAHAHGRGFVHRDVKPSNLLVEGQRALPETSGRARVKILDMGLVRSVEEDPAAAELTRDGTVVGTPDYMSPEQAKNSSTVDARADQYSLGCTLYFLLRGQVLFPGGTPIDKLLRHQLDPVPDIRKARPDIPAGLAEVLARLLAKKPDQRYANCDEAARALAPYCGGEAVPVHEAFSFTDDPTAVATPNAVPDAPRSGGVRLKVRAPRPATPVALPKAHVEEPSSEILAAPRRARPAEPPRPRKRKPQKPAPLLPPAAWWAIGVGATLALSAVAFAAAARVFAQHGP